LSLSFSYINQYRQNYFSSFDLPVFSKETLQTILRYGAPVGAIVEHHPRLDRCMNRLQQMIAESESKGETLTAGTAVVADTLSHSTGRFGRQWYAPCGGAWLAVAWPDILLPEFTRLLPFAVGLACCRTIRSFQLDARLKWVNDLLVGEKKIGGILCETVLSGQGERYHLLGIGVNVNNATFPDELRDNSVSMVEALGETVDLQEFIARFFAELTLALGILHHDEALYMQTMQSETIGQKGELLKLWEQLCDSAGKKVEFGHDVQKKTQYQGLVTGYEKTGGLILELADGSTTVEYSGEIRYL
jgi:BirA family biotin operon repressor/biotin-[acetyl-CoA-carboxylase] ligase